MSITSPPWPDRYQDVLGRIIGGATNPEIARDTYTSLDTIKSRVRTFMHHYQVGHRHQLAVRALQTDYPLPPRPWTGTPLRDREVTILQAVLNHGAFAPAAHDLGLKPLTVKSHIQRIGGKSGTTSRTLYLVVKAYRAGLITYDQGDPS